MGDGSVVCPSPLWSTRKDAEESIPPFEATARGCVRSASSPSPRESEESTSPGGKWGAKIDEKLKAGRFRQSRRGSGCAMAVFIVG
jgi:hypothetical protein